MGALGAGMLFAGSRSASRGPQSHSTTSYSSRPASRPAVRPRPQSRPRFNQPTGFRGSGGGQPSYYYGRRHDYIFFPVAWTDESTGTSYEKGYYDENGTRYDNVSFEKNGSYENVVCHCDYCGSDSVMNLSAENVGSLSLKCPECGAPMEIVSELDEYIDAREDGYSYGDSYDTSGRSEYSYRDVPAGKKRHPIRTIVIIMILLGAIGYWYDEYRSPSGGLSGGGQLPVSGNELTLDSDLPDTVFLAKTGNGIFTVENGASDKKLVWDSDLESYYDEETDCWLWYNTDVEPPVWQYWFEGISSDFEESGWMEHAPEGWFIEESAGNWIPLPAKYGTSRLWYIQ